MILKKKVEPEAEEKKKPIMFVQETENQNNEEEVLMKQMATRKPARTDTRIEAPVYEDAGKVAGEGQLLSPFHLRKRCFQVRRKRVLPSDGQCKY